MTDLEQAVLEALRDLAIKAADLRAARARFDTLVRLRDLVSDTHRATPPPPAQTCER